MQYISKQKKIFKKNNFPSHYRNTTDHKHYEVDKAIHNAFVFRWTAWMHLKNQTILASSSFLYAHVEVTCPCYTTCNSRGELNPTPYLSGEITQKYMGVGLYNRIYVVVLILIFFINRGLFSRWILYPFSRKLKPEITQKSPASIL